MVHFVVYNVNYFIKNKHENQIRTNMQTVHTFAFSAELDILLLFQKYTISLKSIITYECTEYSRSQRCLVC